jgi:hypothetical protein
MLQKMPCNPLALGISQRAQKSALISISNYIFSDEVGRMDQLGTQIRSCFDAELKEIRKLQRLLSQLRVLLRRTIFRQAREQTVL